MPTVDLSFGTLEYRVIGPAPGEAAGTVVFVHGFLVDGTLWDPVAERLAAAGVSCIVPNWPLGSHRIPTTPGSDLSPTALGTAVTALLDALDLRRVVLVGNDTGGAICQLALHRPAGRIAGLVLTNCDAFENFPPKFFVPLFRLARYHLALSLLLHPTRLRLVRHSPLAYGRLLVAPRSARLTRGWIEAAIADPRIRDDITRFARGVRRTELVEAAQWLSRFDGPVRVVWGSRDRCFTLATARRLAAAFPNAQLDEVPDATTFIPIDRPDALIDAIREVMTRLQPQHS